MALDNKGGIFVTGETWATNMIADRFQTFYQGGNSDGYLIKYDYSGQRVWSAYVGGESEDLSLGMSLDTENNIILAGGTWSKEFPADTFIKKVNNDLLAGFIIKLDSSAKKKWATYIHYKVGERVNDVITDKENNVIVTGRTDSPDFANTYDDSKQSQDEMFLMKFDKDCKLTWSRLFGGNANDVGIALAIDSTNHIYVTGESKSLKLPNCKNSPNDTIYPDIFYAKFDKDGNNLWTNRVIGNSWDFATKIQIDSKNNVIVAGHTYSLDIKTNGVQNISNNKDGIVIKCDSTGKEIWSTYVGSMTFDYLNGLCIDRFDNIYCTGGFASTLNSGLQPIEAWNSQYDIILGKIKPDGMFDWFTYFGGWGFDIGFCVNVDQRDNIFVFSQIQSYDYKYDFGYPGGYTRTFISLLKYNYPISIPYKLHPFCIDKADSVQFLLNKKYNEKIHFFAELSDSTGKFDKPVVIGDVYADTSAFIPIQNTNNIKSGDKYRLRITSSDTNLIHVYPENVIISNPPSAVISSASDTVCQGLVSIFEADYFKDCLYEWIPTGGKVISTDSNNCSIRWDSTGIQKLTLIVRNTKSYCESSIQKSIFVLNKPEIKSKSGIELCASDSSFVLDIADTKGGTYSGNHVKGNKFYTDSAGIGSHKVQYSVTDQNGCTNSIEINIIINPVPDKPVIIRTGNYLIATHSIGYQWFYNGNKMLGDTNSEVLANTNGKYTVIVYNEFGCPSVMSDPYDFINSVSDQSQNEIEIYPQPVENILCITNSTDISNPIIISNLIGEQLIRLDNQQTPITQIDVSMLPSGLYFIRQGTILKKFVKL